MLRICGDHPQALCTYHAFFVLLRSNTRLYLHEAVLTYLGSFDTYANFQNL